MGAPLFVPDERALLRICLPVPVFAISVSVMNWAVAAGVVLRAALLLVLVLLMATVKASRWRFPWQIDPGSLWPRLFVYGSYVVLGGGVAAAAHTQVSGGWGAFLIGAGARWWDCCPRSRRRKSRLRLCLRQGSAR